MNSVLSIVVKTIFVYIALMFSIRIMGKRQIGELEASEFIATLLLSEIAAIPIAEESLPLRNAIFPLITILLIEVGVSFIVMKSRKIKKFIDGAPTVIMSKGVLYPDRLKSSRITIDELLSELRALEISDISQVNYIILEPNGKLSAFQKQNVSPCSGIAHSLIIDGCINHSELPCSSVSENRILLGLSRHNIKLSDVLILTVDDNFSFSLMTRSDRFCKSIEM